MFNFFALGTIWKSAIELFKLIQQGGAADAQPVGLAADAQEVRRFRRFRFSSALLRAGSRNFLAADVTSPSAGYE